MNTAHTLDSRSQDQTAPSERPSASDFARTFPADYCAGRELLIHPAQSLPFDCDILEIGPGRGDFLFALAEAHPDRRIAAIELGDRRFAKLVVRINARGIQNVTLIGGDARFAIPRCIPEGCVERIYVLFPDPWPKRRHAYLRLLSTEILTLLCRRLKTGGVLTLKTDVKSYADWVRANATGIRALESVAESLPGVSDTLGVETLYEQRRRDAGETIYTQQWRKTGTVSDSSDSTMSEDL